MSALPAIVLLQIPHHHERVDDSRIFHKTYTVVTTQVYEVEFQLELGALSCIYKRYREFRELRSEVLFPQVKNLGLDFAGFPEKKWFGQLRSNVVERRRLMLEKWLKSFIKYRQTLPILLRFLQAFTSCVVKGPARSVAAIALGANNPETLPQTVHSLVQQACRQSLALDALTSLKSLLTSDDFQVRKTATRELLSQSMISWQEMQLQKRILDVTTQFEALTVFKAISDSGQFEPSQLTNIVREWEEGTQKEEEQIDTLKWKALPCGRDDLDVEFRVQNQMMEMHVRIWVRASLESIVTAITDCDARKRWDERIEDVWVVRDTGHQTLVHYDLMLSGERLSMELLCSMKVRSNTATMKYEYMDAGADAKYHSIYQVTPARIGKLRHSASTGDASFACETYRIDYTILHTEAETRLVLADLLGTQTYFRQTWDNLKEFLELGYSSRRCSEALPPRPRTMSHRSIAVSQGILRQLICSL